MWLKTRKNLILKIGDTAKLLMVLFAKRFKTSSLCPSSGLLLWPAALLLVQTFLSPAIWRSRRNYKEPRLFLLVEKEFRHSTNCKW